MRLDGITKAKKEPYPLGYGSFYLGNRIKLGFVEPCVDTPKGHQGIVVALFHHLTVFQNQNMVSGADGGR